MIFFVSFRRISDFLLLKTLNSDFESNLMSNILDIIRITNHLFLPFRRKPNEKQRKYYFIKLVQQFGNVQNELLKIQWNLITELCVSMLTNQFVSIL